MKRLAPALKAAFLLPILLLVSCARSDGTTDQLRKQIWQADFNFSNKMFDSNVVWTTMQTVGEEAICFSSNVLRDVEINSFLVKPAWAKGPQEVLGSHVVCFDINTGKELWRRKWDRKVFSIQEGGAATSGRFHILAGHQENRKDLTKVKVFHAKSGRLLWENRAFIPGEEMGLSLENEIIFLHDFKGKKNTLSAISLADQKVLWKAKTEKNGIFRRMENRLIEEQTIAGRGYRYKIWQAYPRRFLWERTVPMEKAWEGDELVADALKEISIMKTDNGNLVSAKIYDIDTGRVKAEFSEKLAYYKRPFHPTIITKSKGKERIIAVRFRDKSTYADLRNAAGKITDSIRLGSGRWGIDMNVQSQGNTLLLKAYRMNQERSKVFFIHNEADQKRVLSFPAKMNAYPHLVGDNRILWLDHSDISKVRMTLERIAL